MAGQRVISAVLTLKDKDFASGVKKATAGTKDMERKVKATGNSIREFGRNAKSQFLAVGGIIGTVFAVDKIKDFTVAIIESAAAAKATSAQFEQVFDGIETDAVKALDKIAQETNILPNRLKGSFISMAAFAKTAGADSTKSLSIAERATLAAADGAAFYDKSIESVTESLQSFLKGNFANDAALGISATEFTRNAAAAELFGKKYNDLSEIQKQETLLKMVEDGNKLSGALGQASREGDGFENVVGNLKQSWTDLKAGLGESVLEPAVAGIQRLTAYVQGIDAETVTSKFKAFGSYMADTFGPIFITVKDIVVGLWDTFKDAGGIEIAKGILEGIKGTLTWIRDNSTLIIAGLAGIYGGLLAFKIITGITSAIKTFNLVMTAMKAGTVAQTLAQLGLNTAMLASPLTWIVVGIGAVIAIGVLLWKNWDTVKEKAQALWTVTKAVFGKFKDWMAEKLKPVIGFFAELKVKWDSFKTAISKFKPPAWLTKIGGAISGAASKVKGFIDGSHATGLNKVPRDGYVAELHKGEMVVPASQAQNLRNQGRNIHNVDTTPSKVTTTSRNSRKGDVTIIIENFHAKGVTAKEVIDEMVPMIKLRLANI